MSKLMTPERFQDRWEAYTNEKHQVSGVWKLYNNIKDGKPAEEILTEESDWATTFSPSATKNVPDDAIFLKKYYEGCRLEAYPDPLSGGAPWTIGWGTTKYEDGTPVKKGDKITQVRADQLFIHYTVTRVIPTLEKTIPNWENLNDRQRAALISFSYNLGENFFGAEGFSTISTVLKEKRYTYVPSALMLYRNPGSNSEIGLARRRHAEGLVWNGTPAAEAVKIADRAIQKVSDIRPLLSVNPPSPVVPESSQTPTKLPGSTLIIIPGMVGPKKTPADFGFKETDFHLVMNDRTENITAFDGKGNRLWSVAALARGQGSDFEWKETRTDTPPGIYKIGQIYKDYEIDPKPTFSSDRRSYGWYSFDLVDLEGQERRNGRAGIMIHGGGTGAGWPGAWAPTQLLLPTHGCIRMHNIDLRDKLLPLTKTGDVFVSVFQELR